MERSAAPVAPKDSVVLVGLDFGSTTSSAMVARARIALNSVTGRQEFSDPQVVYRSPAVFTPFDDDGRIDLDRLGVHLDAWLDACGLRPADVFSGGAIVTGLASEAANAAALARFVDGRLGDAVIARAHDPALESWLAFMGACAGLSRAHPETPLLNLDIGGGTTNGALGLGGAVKAMGCAFIGARHLRFSPGTYRLAGITDRARHLLAALGIRAAIGNELSRAEIAAIVGFQVRALEALVAGDIAFFAGPEARPFQDVPLRLPAGLAAPRVVFSGGVGELVYAARAGAPWPGTTAFGDLGIDLARAILASPRLARDLDAFRPEHAGRATVCGLTLHSAEMSGATVFLPPHIPLPLRDLPIIGALGTDAGQEALEAALTLIAHTPAGGCLRIEGGPAPLSGAAVRDFGRRLAAALAAAPPARERPAVLLLAQNMAKAVGAYATDWGRAPAHLVVIDEIAGRDAQFAHIGRMRDGVVPVSFYGLN